MSTYARMVERAIADLDDPMERLAGALITVARLPELSGASVNSGLARLRLKLAEVEPHLVGRSRAPVVELVRGLVEAAAAAGAIETSEPEAMTSLLMSLNSASTTSRTQIGRASGRERVFHYVSISGAADPLKKNIQNKR